MASQSSIWFHHLQRCRQYHFKAPSFHFNSLSSGIRFSPAGCNGFLFILNDQLVGLIVLFLWVGPNSRSLSFSRIFEDLIEDFQPELDLFRLLCLLPPLLHLVAAIILMFSGKVLSDDVAVKHNNSLQNSTFVAVYRWMAFGLALILFAGHIAPLLKEGSKTLFQHLGNNLRSFFISI
jgi:hypothetical protein